MAALLHSRIDASTSTTLPPPPTSSHLSPSITSLTSSSNIRPSQQDGNGNIRESNGAGLFPSSYDPNRRLDSSSSSLASSSFSSYSVTSPNKVEEKKAEKKEEKKKEEKDKKIEDEGVLKVGRSPAASPVGLSVSDSRIAFTKKEKGKEKEKNKESIKEEGKEDEKEEEEEVLTPEQLRQRRLLTFSSPSIPQKKASD